MKEIYSSNWASGIAGFGKISGNFHAISDAKITPNKPEETPVIDLLRNELTNLLDHRHVLYQLAGQSDWHRFESEFGLLYCDSNGSPGKPIRLLMVGLEYLKQIHNVSDEQVVQC